MRDSMNATGMIINTYRQRDMTSDGVPLPRPSRAPELVTLTDEMMKPALIILSALSPVLIASVSLANSDVSQSGTARNSAVPSAMIAAVIMRTILYIFLTRPYSPAP